MNSELGKKLAAIRKRIVASGTRLLSADEIDAELGRSTRCRTCGSTEPSNPRLVGESPGVDGWLCDDSFHDEVRR